MAVYTNESDTLVEYTVPDSLKSKAKQPHPKDTAPLIIGVNGLAGAGKDTISNMVLLSLQNDHRLKGQCFAFAYSLKKAASVIFNVPLEHFYDRTLKEVVVPYWGMSPRQMAQQLGTEACRKGIRDDIWIKSLESTVVSSGVDIAFVTDVRFDNEAEFVHKYNGIVINLYRPDQVAIADSGHASEAGIDSKLVTHKLQNTTGNPFMAAATLQSIILEALS